MFGCQEDVTTSKMDLEQFKDHPKGQRDLGELVKENNHYLDRHSGVLAGTDVISRSSGEIWALISLSLIQRLMDLIQGKSVISYW